MERGNLARVSRRVLSRTWVPVRPRTPPGVGTPLRANGHPGSRHPSSHDVPDWGETKRRERMEGQDCLACSQSPHDETVVARRAQSGPALLPARRKPPATESGKKKETKEQRHPSNALREKNEGEEKCGRSMRTIRDSPAPCLCSYRLRKEGLEENPRTPGSLMKVITGKVVA